MRAGEHNVKERGFCWFFSEMSIRASHSRQLFIFICALW